jgi:hypothetical protein
VVITAGKRPLRLVLLLLAATAGLSVLGGPFTDTRPLFEMRPDPGTGALTIIITDAHQDLRGLHFVYASSTSTGKTTVQSLLKPTGSSVSPDTHTFTYTFGSVPPCTFNFEAGLGNLELMIETPYTGAAKSLAGRWIPLD